MLHEVLLALVGHSGSIIQEQPIYETKSRSRKDKPATTFRVPDSITFLASTERVAINRVVGLGVTYRELRQFVRPRPQAWRPHVASLGKNRAESSALGDNSLYIRAFKIGVEELLDEYSKRVAEVERDVMGDPTLTIARIDAGIREYQPVLPAVWEACLAVMGEGREGPLEGAEILEMLHERCNYGSPDVQRRLCRISWHCNQVLVNQCVSWLLHGLLVDPYNEFFVQRRRDPAAPMGLRLDAVEGALGAQDLNEAGVGPWCGDHDGGWSRAKYGDWRAEEGWNSSYTLRWSMVPTSLVPYRVALQILFVGKVVRALKHSSPPVGFNQPGVPGAPGGRRRRSLEASDSDDEAHGVSPGSGPKGGDGEGVENVGVTEAEVLLLSRRWRELRERESFHLLSLERAVKEADALVDRRLYKLLMTFFGLDRHLDNLKNLFLMGYGALFHSFLVKARDAMRSPAGDRAVVDLNSWLAAAAEDQGQHGSVWVPSSRPRARRRSLDGKPSDGDGDSDSNSSHPVHAAAMIDMSMMRIDLESPGFVCKAFHDLPGFSLTGKAVHESKNAFVSLCPGVPSSRISSPGRVNAASEGRTTPRAQPRADETDEDAMGSIWCTSGRELASGFHTSLVFRCDDADAGGNRKRTVAEAEGGGDRGEARALGGKRACVSFTIHNNRAVMSPDSDEAEKIGGGLRAVPNGLSVCLDFDEFGAGEVSVRWRPPSSRNSPINPRQGIGDWNVHGKASPRHEEGDVSNLSLLKSPGDGSGERVLGQGKISPSSRLSLGQVNYLMVEYTPGASLVQPRRRRRREKGSGRSRSSSALRVFVNDPGRLGSAVLSVDLDVSTILRSGGGRAFFGVSARGPWRVALKQWEFHAGGAGGVGRGQRTEGPLGGTGSGPKVEEMLLAMESWNGLLLHYRVEWPLHLVLTRDTMQTYNRLFGLLASVKRANLELERVWPMLMHSRYRCSSDRWRLRLGPLWMLRSRMSFFVSNLAFYLQVDTVEAAYSVLKATLAGVEDFVSLQRAHQEFLDTLRTKFHLDDLVVSQGIARVLRHVMRFCCLFALHGDAKDILPGDVAALHSAFHDEIDLLFPVLQRIAKELAMRLDFNGYFSVQASVP